MQMEAKHWFGLVGAGAALIALSFIQNDPKAPGDVEGARVPQGTVAQVEIPDAPTLVSIPTPSVTTSHTTKPKVTKPKQPAPSASNAAPEAAGTPTGELSRDWDGAMIAGKTVWADKKSPRLRKVDMGSDPVCKSLHSKDVYSEQYVVDKDNGLANVIVYVEKVPDGEYPMSKDPVILDQIGCIYVPHVVGIQLGQKVIIRNSDSTQHNVHFKGRLNTEWNKSQSTKGDMEPLKAFARPEVGTALFKCDIHPWMEARVGVFDHPFFAISKSDGTFAIPQGLPDGKYEVTAWHEKCKTASATLTVVKGKTSEVNFSFTKKKKNKAKVIAEGK